MKTVPLPLLALGVFVVLGTAGGEQALAGPEPAATAKTPPAPGDAAMEASKEAVAPDDMSASRNAARTRMRECGHQWSTMKKSGAASGLTWKDFSQNCLARK